ncbi:hypothetical protein TNCV_4232441 [Trichonephila clavipes]|nr:hypothetical protein TNCV_4232441 [Trichonephila clavipes]
MFDSSSFADTTPLAHADTSRDVLPRGAAIISEAALRSPFKLPVQKDDQTTGYSPFTGFVLHYTRAFGDGTRNFEPWSSDDRLLLLSITPQKGEDVSALDRFNVHRSSTRQAFSGTGTATAGSDVVQSGRPIFDDFFQQLWPYIGNNTANVVFQMVKRLWLIRIDQ